MTARTVEKLDLIRWADGRFELDPRDTLMLTKLALYADERGHSWARMETLAKAGRCSVRTAQVRVHRMIEEGYLRPTGETYLNDNKREVPFYELAPGCVELRPWLADGWGAETAPQPKGSGAEKAGSRVQRGCTPKEPIGTYEQTDVCSTRTREREIGFEDWWDALPERMRKISSRKLARVAMAGPARRLGWPALVASARAYAADPVIARQDWLPKAQTWAKNEGFVEFLPGQGGGATPTRAPFADAKVRAEVLAARGEAFVASWLDGCGWDGEARVILPPLTEKARKLNSEIGPLLKRLGVRVGAVGASAGKVVEGVSG